MTVATDGTMTVTVDGAAYGPPSFAPAWRREDFARILDQFTGRLRSPVRVEVRETDGTTFTDIVTPGKPRHTTPAPAPLPPAPTPAAALAAPELVELHAEGFIPGEDVAVAIVVGHSDATNEGTMRALLTAEQVAESPTREVILLGRVSGTLTVGQPE